MTNKPTESTVESSAVILRDVTVGYDSTPVLEHSNLEIGWGLMVGVIGPNGAGKSTLIKTILGTLRPMEGSVRVGGYDSQTRDARDTIGYVPQREAVNWDFPVTVEDVVMMGRTARLGWLRFPGASDKTDSSAGNPTCGHDRIRSPPDQPTIGRPTAACVSCPCPCPGRQTTFA